MKKVTMIALPVAAVVAIVLGLNSFTTVYDGYVKVETTFGKVKDSVLPAGIHFVNPMSEFTEYEIRNNKYVVEGLLLPTKDRFNSTVNVTVTYRIDGNVTPKIRREYGSMATYIDRAMSIHLTNIVKDEGRKIADSRGLADSGNITAMQHSAKARLQEALDGTGITLSEVLIQDITFDPRIAQQILDTQQRIQREEAEKSQERIEASKAQQVIEAKRGETESLKLQADADLYVEQQTAAGKKAHSDAERYAMEQIAAGNRELQHSLTPQILKLKELEVAAIEAGKGWNGQFGDNMTIVVGTDGKAPNVPVLFKQMK